MMNIRFATLGSALTIAMATLTTAAIADDRPATAAERAEIGQILKANGFQSWKKIEFDTDDNKFEVDDAIHTDGRKYDVDIRNGAIIKKERD